MTHFPIIFHYFKYEKQPSFINFTKTAISKSDELQRLKCIHGCNQNMERIHACFHELEQTTLKLNHLTNLFMQISRKPNHQNLTPRLEDISKYHSLYRISINWYVDIESKDEQLEAFLS